MSLADSLLIDFKFERLEEFPSYTSFIKCFGKPIIPALLSQRDKNEISALKEEAIKKEQEISRLKKARYAYYKIQDDGVSDEQNGSLQNEFLLPGMCALSLNYINSSSDNSSFLDEMHTSMSKIPSTDICSTVHTGVIVCPNEVSAGNKYDLPFESPSKQTFIHHQFSSSDCNLCQIDSDQRLYQSSANNMCDNSAEQMSSVSDEEEGQDSTVEDTDFESLPTVVSAKKVNMQDTDDESNITCLTQSTDLDKYMDCSIEYSSPDDLTGIASSQMSSQITLSCRSDDASSETLVNTESELTPCASAMAELNGYPDEDGEKGIGESLSCATTSEVTVASTHNRTCSVDSYLVNLRPQTLLMKKSQSEPSHSNVLRKTSSAQEIQSEKQHEGGRGDSAENTETPVRKKKHVRSNSYTLDSPSSALIMAHANCGCDLHDADNNTPHSCTPDRTSQTSNNMAFKKEKVNVVLPPTPDRDKMFPILSSGPFSHQILGSDLKSFTVEPNSLPESSFLDSSGESKELSGFSRNKSKENIEFSVEELSPVVECPEKISGTELDESLQSTLSSSRIESQSKEMSPDVNSSHSEVRTVSPNEGISATTDNGFEMSSNIENADKTEGIQVILSQIFQDIQESQKMRVNQLLEEQNRQWLQLQEEFKEQERQLCAKLNLVNIPSGFPLDHPKEAVENSNVIKTIPSRTNISPNVTSMSLSNASSEESQLNSTVRKVKECSEINFSEVSDQSNNVQETFSSGTLSTDTSRALHSSASNRDFKFLPPQSPSNDMKEDQTNNSFANNKESVLTVGNSSIQSYITNQDAQTSLSVAISHEDVRSDIIDSSGAGTTEPETSTTNASPSRKIEVPSSLSLTHGNTFPFSSSESLKINYDYQNILLQSSNDLPSLTKFYPIPVSGADLASTPSAVKRSVLTCNMGGSRQKGYNLLQEFCGKGEVCALSPMSPCICVAVHEQEFNAECPNCHACMNCDTNCLKHMNHSQGDIQELNGYATWEDADSRQCDTPEDKSSPLIPEFTSGKLGDITQENVNGDALHAHFYNTEDCDDDDQHLFKENIDFKQMSLIQKAVSENRKFLEKYANASNKHIVRKVSSVKQTSKPHPSSSSLYSFSKDAAKPKHLVNSRSLKKGDESSSLSQKNKKTQDVSLISKADALKKLAFPSASNLKRRQSREILEALKDPSIQKKLEKLPAMVKGYLTRRLFNSERVQDLVKTLKDTVLIIGKLSEELTSKSHPVSEQDVDFHRQLIVQLMTTFRNVYDIFCTYSIKEQMKIISESRNIRMKKRTEEKKVVEVSPTVSQTSNSSHPNKNSKLSAATVKSLERKRRCSIDNRTYTIEDFKGCRPRICTKTRVTSPSRIYKSAMDLNLKSKSKSVKTQHWK